MVIREASFFRNFFHSAPMMTTSTKTISDPTSTLGARSSALTPKMTFKPMVDAVARIFTSRPVSNADHLTQAFLHDFYSMYDAIPKDGNTALPFWNEYLSRSLLIGKRVRFRDGKRHRSGKVLSVSESGALIVLGNGGERYEITSQSALL